MDLNSKRFVRALACIDAAAAIAFLVGGIWMLRDAALSRAEAIQRYGIPMDAGANDRLIACGYLLPAFGLFAVAAVTLWRGWPNGWVPQLIAAGWVIIPLLLVTLALFTDPMVIFLVLALLPVAASLTLSVAIIHTIVTLRRKRSAV